MIFKSLHLKNFQGHKDSKLEFDPGFNLIIGPSDNGKSSIVRAVEWLRLNKPKGIGFLRHDSKEVVVKLTTDNAVIERKRTEKDTGSYVFNEGDIYSVMGGNVPPQVSGALNLEDINVQLQLDTHFLILETPGKAASIINQVTKLDKIDEGLSKLKSKKTSVSKEIEGLNENLREVKEFLDSGIQDVLSDLSTLRNNISFKTVERNKLVEKIRDVQTISQRLTIIKEGVIRLRGIDDVRLEVDRIKDRLDEVSKIYDSIEEVVDKVRKLKNADETALSLDGNIANLLSEKKELEKKIDTCPYCGSLLDTESRNRLLKGGEH